MPYKEHCSHWDSFRLSGENYQKTDNNVTVYSMKRIQKYVELFVQDYGQTLT